LQFAVSATQCHEMDPSMDLEDDRAPFSPNVFAPNPRQFGRTSSYNENDMASSNATSMVAPVLSDFKSKDIGGALFYGVPRPSTPEKHGARMQMAPSTPEGGLGASLVGGTPGGAAVLAPSPAAVVFNLGRFTNDFDVQAVLGEGSFGTVFAARGKMDGIEYAVKRSKRRFHGEHDRDNMLIEIHACSKLSAASEDDEIFSIVRYFSAWIEDEHVFLQMELCEISLEGMLSSGHRFDVPDTFLVLRHVLLALKFLHSHGFVHLDVKPANILRKQGHFKLGDFGLARRFLQQGHVMSGVEEGDSRYLAPELLEWNIRDKDLTKADLFSAGITAYEMVTLLQLPQNGDVWHSLRTNNFPLAPVPGCITQELVDVIRALMHADPAQRPSAEASFACFLGLASDKDQEIHRLRLQNESLKSQLSEVEKRAVAVAGGGAIPPPGKLKRHHSIM